MAIIFFQPRILHSGNERKKLDLFNRLDFTANISFGTATKPQMCTQEERVTSAFRSINSWEWNPPEGKYTMQKISKYEQLHNRTQWWVGWRRLCKARGCYQVICPFGTLENKEFFFFFLKKWNINLKGKLFHPNEKIAIVAFCQGHMWVMEGCSAIRGGLGMTCILLASQGTTEGTLGEPREVLDPVCT